MSDLTPEEREAFDHYVEHFRRDVLQQMMKSAVVMTFVPDRQEFDVKFATELGASIMLDKPLLAVVMPGAPVPEKMRLVVDKIVRADIDTDEGRREVARAVRDFQRRHV
jgi:hypothetical protein